MAAEEGGSGQIGITRGSYRTLDHFAEARFTDKRSEFIAWASPAAAEEEALQLLARSRSTFPDAKHHVYAWILGGAEQRIKYSDAGEPAGTAGLPVLDVLRKNGVEDAAIVVARYFGGTLLGTGGLVRAYSGAASLALREACPVMSVRCAVYRCSAAYPDFERIRRALKGTVLSIGVTGYGADVRFEIVVDDEKKEALVPAYHDAGCGRASIDYEGIRFVKTPQADGSGRRAAAPPY